MRNKKKLLIEQLDRKLKPFEGTKKIETPSNGWINSIRTAFNMTLGQLAKQLDITVQGVRDLEKRESVGSVSIKNLKEVAKALNMQLVYAFVPNNGTVEEIIDKKSQEVAKKIVLRTHQTMKLEDQANDEDSIKKAIDELATELKREMNKILWD